MKLFKFFDCVDRKCIFEYNTEQITEMAYKRKSQISIDTIAHIGNADKHLGIALGVLRRRTKEVGQEIADLEWARILIENSIRGLRKLKTGED